MIPMISVAIFKSCAPGRFNMYPACLNVRKITIWNIIYRNKKGYFSADKPALIFKTIIAIPCQKYNRDCKRNDGKIIFQSDTALLSQIVIL